MFDLNPGIIDYIKQNSDFFVKILAHYSWRMSQTIEVDSMKSRIPKMLQDEIKKIQDRISKIQGILISNDDGKLQTLPTYYQDIVLALRSYHEDMDYSLKHMEEQLHNHPSFTEDFEKWHHLVKEALDKLTKA